MELIQFSTPTCPPCKAAKAYIESEYQGENYTWIDVTIDNGEKFNSLAEFLGIRSVPTFAIIEGTDILGSFKGFDKTSIDGFYDKLYNEGGITEEEVLALLNIEVIERESFNESISAPVIKSTTSDDQE